MKILLIEDEIKIGNAIKKGLIQEGYNVDIAIDGIMGLELFYDIKPDLLILDLMIPEKDGISILKELRKANFHTPVLILSAKAETQDKIAGLNMGADDYLSKPFSFEELLARVDALLRRPHTLVNQNLKFKDIEIDLEKFQVKKKGTEIQLSKKEFQLLEYLIRNSNRIVSKENIINNLWEYESDILPNNVEVFIGYLRNKIDKPFGDSLIKTVRGFGYKLGE